MKEIPVRKINASLKEPARPEGFSIRDIQALLNGKRLVHELHRHDFFFMLALKKGAGTHEIDFIEHKIIENSIFILRPGQVHKLQLEKGCTGLLVEFAPHFYHPNDKLSRQRLGRATSRNFYALQHTGFDKLLYLLSYTFNEFVEKKECYAEVIKANLEIFFIEFIRQSQDSQSTSKGVNTYGQERLGQFLELLGIGITKFKQVSQYADQLNISVYQLNAITKTTVGKPASQLINEQIVLEAKRYLLATAYQVKEIADHLGYEDISYFIRFFKKHTGYSPEVFRKTFK